MNKRDMKHMVNKANEKQLEMHITTPPNFNSSPLKNGRWKTILSYWEGNFSGAMLNFGGVYMHCPNNPLKLAQSNQSKARSTLPSIAVCRTGEVCAAYDYQTNSQHF